jgi:hypothetical protein
LGHDGQLDRGEDFGHAVAASNGEHQVTYTTVADHGGPRAGSPSVRTTTGPATIDALTRRSACSDYGERDICKLSSARRATEYSLFLEHATAYSEQAEILSLRLALNKRSKLICNMSRHKRIYLNFI